VRVTIAALTAREYALLHKWHESALKKQN